MKISVGFETVPYTYMLGWRNRDRWYYGVRFAKGCHPDDLWVKYKSSSTLVKEYARRHGDPDVIRVMRVFSTREAACNHEMRFLQRWGAVRSRRFLNRAINNLRGQSPRGMRRKHTCATIEKMRQTWAKKKKAGYVRVGRRRSAEERAAISERQRRRFADPIVRGQQAQIAAAASKRAAEVNRGKPRPAHVQELIERRRGSTGTRYPTPYGLLRRKNDVFTEDLITRWCKRPDVVISRHSFLLGCKKNPIDESWVGRTRREVGFSEPITLVSTPE